MRPTNGNRPRIALLVDDDEAMRYIFRKMLGRLGFYVVVCHTARRALEILTNPELLDLETVGLPEASLPPINGSGQVFDLLLTDFDMPEIDGLELIRQARSAKIGPRSILLFTVRSESIAGLSAETSELEAVAMEKPSDLDGLKQAIDSVLRW